MWRRAETKWWCLRVGSLVWSVGATTHTNSVILSFSQWLVIGNDRVYNFGRHTFLIL
jgi:hypothetical protein